ncbi:uncharacterized protein LOC118348648 [Juglans regia]|uniref:Uncharacterized protein LOC118348648 n=1 Tax=Juglans regia TaxID=51240 RepID=A0A6P9EGX5_JUGRE|nr:uncharacterized protein LOC118348648 [Juglans regia]
MVVSSKTAKLEFPRFSGDDPTEWFNRVNQFFEFQNTPEAQRVSLASYHLEGEANQWWQWIRRTLREEGRALSWANFENELWARFGPSECEDFDEALSRIRQVGSLRDYQREFERLGNRVHGWTQRALVGTFMGGLKMDISDGIRMFKPQTLKEAISLARMKDDQLARQRRFVRPAPTTRAPLALPPTNRAAPPGPTAPGPRILMLENCEDNSNLLGDDGNVEQPTEETHEEPPEPEITLHALAGWTAPKTMRVAAKIGSHNIVVLIDSGSTHNFISERLANGLRLPVAPTETFNVRIANGDKLKCQGRFDQKQLTMEFLWENQTKRLQGADGGNITDASMKELSKEAHQSHTIFAICLQVNTKGSTEEIHPEVQEILQEFSELFQEPTSLPPARDIDHFITLKEGTEPINYKSLLITSSSSEKEGWKLAFCTDYRALNAATIKDRFPIPTVDDMLDELYGYYRKFVKNYGIVARTLTNLLKKGQFGWHEEAEAAFVALKQAMTTTPILAMPNFNDKFTIETDASGEGIGAVLAQQGRPVAFMSRALGVAKKSWSTYAKEMLAIVEAFQLWRPYLLGRKFYIQTDQRSLKYFLEQRITTPEQQKWVAKLLGYDYEITYRPGRENSAADALSRKQGSPVLHNIFFSQVDLWEEIKQAAREDPYIQSKGRIATNQSNENYVWHNGLLRYKNKVIVPADPTLRNKLLHEMHDTKVGGHSGILRTYKKLGQQFYWPGMLKSVQEYIKCCEVCQKIKTETLAPAGLLQPLPIPCQVWDDITLDFIEGLPTLQGKDTIMVVVDRLSKSAHFLTLTHPFTAKGVAEKFVEGVLKLHGMPRSIVSDRDPIFVSNFWQEFFRMSGTKLKLSSAYHP